MRGRTRSAAAVLLDPGAGADELRLALAHICEELARTQAALARTILRQRQAQPGDRQDGRPLTDRWRQAVRALAPELGAGGESLISANRIASRHGLSEPTLRRVIRQLHSTGIIESRGARGVGTYVRVIKPDELHGLGA